MSGEPKPKRVKPSAGAPVKSHTLISSSITNTSTQSLGLVGEVIQGLAATAQINAGVQETFGSTFNSQGSRFSISGKGSSLDIIIEEFLSSVYDRAAKASSKPANVEIEFRLGQICEKTNGRTAPTRVQPSSYEPVVIPLTSNEMTGYQFQFVAGVSQTNFESLRDQLSTIQNISQTHSNQRVNMYKNHVRIIEDLSDPTMLIAETKETLETLTIFIPHCDYDIRLSVAVESDQRRLDQLPEEKPEKSRRRNRTSYTGSGLYNLSLDFTEVKTGREDNSEQNNDSLEVEFEVSKKLCDLWINSNNPDHVVTNLWRCVCSLIPDIASGVRLDYKNSEIFRNICSHTVFNFSSFKSSAFPGTMPVGFARRNFPLVKNPEYNYFVSEKTDGVRYFLVVVPKEQNSESNIVLLDRTYSTYSVVGLRDLSYVLSDKTILDGELVYNRRDKRPYFIVFDALMISGEVLVNHPLIYRLSKIQDFLSINSAYATQLAKNGLSDSALPLVRKAWFQIHQINEVLRRIKEVGHEKEVQITRMYDDEEKRCHHTDGIVFSPNSPYICSSSENYLKWKWTDQVTIDLLGEIKNNGELQLLAAAAGRDNNNSIDLSSTIKLAVNTQEALQQEIRKTGGGVVVELGYCHKDGLWHSKGYRFDKV
eukprot:c21736_g1_i2.p1 GENE.c21736_g1_i2~~c21736_g1_i2.p1  ORF type:complete len:650 (-),score=225.24 c21736_g1_i2:39-1988(-)